MTEGLGAKDGVKERTVGAGAGVGEKPKLGEDAGRLGGLKLEAGAGWEAGTAGVKPGRGETSELEKGREYARGVTLAELPKALSLGREYTLPPPEIADSRDAGKVRTAGDEERAVPTSRRM